MSLPSDVSTGTVTISIRTIGLVSQDELTPESVPVIGRVTFTPSPEYFLHPGEGMVFSTAAQTVYLGDDGDATVVLMATNDPDVQPTNWTYLVTFVLEGLKIPSFHMSVPSDSTQDLAQVIPVPQSDGEYYLTGPQGPAGPTGPQGIPGTTSVPAYSAAPASGLVQGQMYLDTSTTKTKGLRYYQDTSWKTLVPFNSFTTHNPFGGRGFYRSSLDNAMFRAEARWVVTGTLKLQSDNSTASTLTETQMAIMFNGDYETGFDIPAGQYLVLNINFNGANFSGYPYGWFYVSHYHVNFSTAVTARVYCNYAPQGVGWKDLTWSDEARETTALIQKAYNTWYALTDVELTITGQAAGGAIARITQIEWYLDRPGLGNEMPVLDKYKANSLYSQTNWKSITGVTNAYINEAGNASFANIAVTGTAALPSGTTVGGAALVSPSHTHNLISGIPDTRTVATLPNDYTAQARWQFKQSVAIGLPGGTTTSYVGLYGQRCYPDLTGDLAQEVAYWGTDIYRRTGTVAANTWQPWVKMPTSLPRTSYVFSDTKATLIVGAGTAKVPNATGRTLTLVAVRVDLATAPTGATLIVDVNKNGASVFSPQTNRPTVAIGATSAYAAAINATTWAADEVLTVDIDQVGSTVAGGGMTVTIIAEG